MQCAGDYLNVSSSTSSAQIPPNHIVVNVIGKLLQDGRLMSGHRCLGPECCPNQLVELQVWSGLRLQFECVLRVNQDPCPSKLLTV